MDGRNSVLRYIISSCQSAATSEIVKRFWSRTRVRSAVTSIATFTFNVENTAVAVVVVVVAAAVVVVVVVVLTVNDPR